MSIFSGWDRESLLALKDALTASPDFWMVYSTTASAFKGLTVYSIVGRSS